MSKVSVSGSFTAAGTSDIARGVTGTFSVSIQGTFVATVKLERRSPNSTSWETVSRDSAGTDASYTAPANIACCEPTADGADYRLECSAYTSGTVTYRIEK